MRTFTNPLILILSGLLFGCLNLPPAPVPAPAEVVEVPTDPPTPEPTATVPPPPVSGALDPTFGRDGFVKVASARAGEHRLSAVTVLSDGSIAGVGYGPFHDGTDIAAVRFLPNGTLDTSFGSGGVARVGRARGFGSHIAQDAQGRIWVAGYAYSSKGQDLVIGRLDPRGRLDPTFADKGVLRRDFGNTDDRPGGLLITRDGRIVVVGNHKGGRVAAACFEPDGSPKTAFGRGGVSVVEVSARGRAFVTRGTLQNDNKIVMGGYVPRGAGFVLRLLPNGAPDSAFGDGGLGERPGGGCSSAWALAVDSQQRVFLACSTSAGPAAVVRWLADGKLDRSWGNGGVALSDPRAEDQFYALLIDADNQVTGIGFRDLARRATPLLARFTESGQVDPSFGDGGRILETSHRGSFLFGGAADSQGRLVVAGEASTGEHSRWFVARYQ